MGIAKFEIRRKCMVCGESFMAKTIESWYCSPRCSKIAYHTVLERIAAQSFHSSRDGDIMELSAVQEGVASNGGDAGWNGNVAQTITAAKSVLIDRGNVIAERDLFQRLAIVKAVAGNCGASAVADDNLL